MPASQRADDSPDLGPAEPWLTCVAPLVAFLVAGVIEPSPSGGGLAGMVGIGYTAYPMVYAVRLAATVAVLVWVWPQARVWLGRPTWWPPLMGLALVVPWVVLATLQHHAGWTFGAGERVGYNPFLPEHLGPDSTSARVFLAMRGLGLVVVVPIIEELFLRGFLMRYAIKDEFWRVPFGLLTAASAAACMVYAVATHPGEAIAAVGWFAVVSGIAAATRKPIDCILCHAATNLALGAYVLVSGEWWLV